MTPETRAQLEEAMGSVLCACGHELRRHDPEDAHCDAPSFIGYDRCDCPAPQSPDPDRTLDELRLDAVLAHRESIVCPNPDCVDGWWWCDIGDGEHIKQRCGHCTDGRILGPTVLVERAEYEQVGWYLERGNFSYALSADAADGKDRTSEVRRSDQEETS